ncbi:MAG: ABC transporter ATP-binding protein [Deltaproteobacteria bacterium]|nr:ABC transporter ATP-binding protein [Deltaproteobacteria bacterium]
MILQTEGLCKYFGGLKAVEQVSLSIKAGQIFGLIGPNGAGKTTFQNCISGTYPPNQGVVKFKGRDITALKAHKCCHAGMARTYQIVRSFPQMTVLENAMVGAIFSGRLHKDKAATLAARKLDFVEFPVSHDTPACFLNTMQLKRLELARALASNCEFLLLDEVAAGLTPPELDDIIVLIRKIRDQGITILIVEHLMKLIMNVCDQIVVLNFGQKIADGTPKEISKDEAVAKAYLGAESKLR